VIIYEPVITGEDFEDMPVVNDITAFKQRSDVIIANRQNEELGDVSEKLYTRDVFVRD
jgi:UDPglucose 6-dehydrogenase